MNNNEKLTAVSTAFKIGQEYKRKTAIHDVYGGQSQGGISTPRNFPVIFIFISDTGKKHGYINEFIEGILWYTGEGQIGDMEMVAGNKAIRDHAKNGKIIHIFEYTKKAHVRYVGTADCLGFHNESGSDRDGNDRNTIVFHLDVNSTGIENYVSEPPSSYYSKDIRSLKTKSLSDLRKAALCSTPKETDNKERQAIAHYRSEALKLYVIARSKGLCEGCGCNAPFRNKNGPFLECHHVHRLADGGPDHPENVVALCPNCHRRAHYADEAISFNKILERVAIEAELFSA